MRQVAGGASHTAVITTKGELVTFGCGNLGQLGHGNIEDMLVPRKVDAFGRRRVFQVAAGWYHTAVITTEGELFTFGNGYHGQLGHNDGGKDMRTPCLVEALMGKRVLQVAAGCYHTAAVTNECELFTFGCGNLGQLGHGGIQNEWVPRKVNMPNDKRVQQVAAGVTHTAAITSEGELFTFGSGKEGALGHGKRENLYTPHKVDAFEGKRVFQVAAGACHTAVITTDDELFTFGSGHLGQLGHCDTDDELFTFGSGHLGQLGHCEGHDRTRPSKVEAFDGKRVQQVAAGFAHTVAVTTDGEVFTFGYGSFGQLGNGDIRNHCVSCNVRGSDRVLCVAVGWFHTAAVVAKGHRCLGPLGHNDSSTPHPLHKVSFQP